MLQRKGLNYTEIHPNYPITAVKECDLQMKRMLLSSKFRRITNKLAINH